MHASFRQDHNVTTSHLLQCIKIFETLEEKNSNLWYNPQKEALSDTITNFKRLKQFIQYVTVKFIFALECYVLATKAAVQPSS